MVWLWLPLLSCKVGKWWGKFVSAWNDSSPRSLHNPQKIPTCALHHCFPFFFLHFFFFIFFFFNNLITTSCSSSPGRMQGSRGCPPYCLSNVESWRVTGRTCQDGSGRTQSQHSRPFRAWGMLGKSPIYRSVKDITWLRSTGDQSPPIPPQQPDTPLVNIYTMLVFQSNHSQNCQEGFKPACLEG